MSANTVGLISTVVYTTTYILLARSVPYKTGVGFIARLRVYYTTTDWCFWLEWNQAVFSIITVVLYISNSYYTETFFTVFAMKLEVFFAIFYAFNFLFELVISKNRWTYVLSLLGIVDIATIIPVIAALATGDLDNTTAGFVRFYRVLALSKVFKPLRLIRAVGTLSPGKDAVVEQTTKIIAYLVFTLFFATGMVQVLSQGKTEDWGEMSYTDSTDSGPMAFHDALYFIIITFSTVGYGDISPPDIQSRLAIILLVGFFFFMIPRELSTLSHLLELSSKYTGDYPKKLTGGHAIIGCDVAAYGLVAAFLEEFFHEDHGYNTMHLVMLVPHEPTIEWKSLVLKFATNDRVTYLKGDLRNTADLHRVSAQTASFCFILANRHGNCKEEEKRCFMRAISVQDFNPTIQIFVEALTIGMKKRLIKVGINPRRVVCVSTINTWMLANACAWEGAATLINNLLVSTSIAEQRDMSLWVKDYTCGLGKEIYVVSIGAFAGQGFNALVRDLFEKHGVILLGIIEDRRVVPHPGARYVITRNDLGFLVTDDVNAAESIIKNAGILSLPRPSTPSPAHVPTEARGHQSPTVPASVAEPKNIPDLGCTAKSEASRVALLESHLSFPGEVTPDTNISVGVEETGVFEVRFRSPSSTALRRGGTPTPDMTSTESTRVGRGLPQEAKKGFGAGRGWNLDARQYIILVTPTLARVSKLVQALEAPQVPGMEFRVICPLYEWNQQRDMKEIRRLRKFPQVSLLVGPPSETSLRAAGASGAKMVVLEAGKSFPEQEASDADAETIGQIVEVIAAAGKNTCAVVQLNDMTYGNHFETLMDRLRNGPAPAAEEPILSTPPISPQKRLLKMITSMRVRFGEKEDISLSEKNNREHTIKARRQSERRGGSSSDRDRERTPTSTRGRESGGSWARAHWMLSKGVASGAIVPSSLPETLLCQAFYNPAIIMIVEALLDPRALGTDSASVRSDDCSDGSRLSDEQRGGGPCGRSDGVGGASFLAQIPPPKTFFRQAMLKGTRPNFQALLDFMLSEYDVLPFGLLRHEKAMGHPLGSEQPAPKFVQCCPPPGQKVMPLDKVFLLAPNLGSWEKMKPESPSTRPVRPATGPIPPLSSYQRGFLPDQRCTPCDERGFPVVAYRAGTRRRAPRVQTPPSSTESGKEPRRAAQPPNLFLSPFRSDLLKMPASSQASDQGAYSAKSSSAEVEDDTSRGRLRRNRDRHDAESLRSLLPQKDSDAKLDLLLREVRHMNAKMDAIVDRLGVLEETRDTDEVKVEHWSRVAS